MSEVVEYRSLRDLALALGIDWPESVPDSVVEVALATLCDLPEVQEFLTTRRVAVPPPGGSFGYLVPRTQIFLNLGRFRDLRGDVAVAAAVYGMTQNEPATFFATSVRKILDSVKRLKDSEYEVVLAIIRLSDGRPYKVAVPEALLQERFSSAPFELNSVLDHLERAEVIARVRPAALRLRL